MACQQQKTQLFGEQARKVLETLLDKYANEGIEDM